ncbi:MAG: metallophosphoesterase family protein [Betaproteobacteria bacterium]
MQIALLSDIHSNLHALNACLRHAAESGATRFAFLGDFVGYGGDPCGVVDVVSDYVANGAVALKGNHDEALETLETYANEASQAALDHARAVLSDEQKRFLAGLPLIVREDGMCLVHASAEAPEKWTYIDGTGLAKRCADAAQASYTFCGHMHDQVLYFESSGGRMNQFHPLPGTAIPVYGGRSWVMLVGSVGQPRDGNPRAAYTMFDTDGHVTFHRVHYDAAGAAKQIRKAGLPASLGQRLQRGI